MAPFDLCFILVICTGKSASSRSFWNKSQTTFSCLSVRIICSLYNVFFCRFDIEVFHQALATTHKQQQYRQQGIFSTKIFKRIEEEMELVVFSTDMLKRIEEETELVIFSAKMLKRIEEEWNWSSFHLKC
jgi:hypothetical protein